MKRRLNNRGQAGFTIVETILVLAIAGLILLIVFEAIPVLERNGRNNQRKQDVQTILDAVSHYELNNSANIPACGGGGQPLCVGTGGTEPLGHPSLSYFTASQITVSVSGVDTNGADASGKYLNPGSDKLSVINHAKCDASNDGSANDGGASYSDIVALYVIENGSGLAPECQQL